MWWLSELKEASGNMGKDNTSIDLREIVEDKSLIGEGGRRFLCSFHKYLFCACIV